MAQYSPKHRAPGRHKAKRRFGPGGTPAVAAVTAAGVSVTGVTIGGSYVASGLSDFTDDGGDTTLVLSDLKLPGPLTPTTAARLSAGAKKGSGPRFTERTVTPTATASPTATAVAGSKQTENEQIVDLRGGGVLDRTAAERRRAEERAARSLARLDPNSARAIAAAMLDDYGWDATQFECLDALWTHESGWRVDATNPSSGAYGIPQAWPAEKMASAGPDWRTNPETQIRWGLGYIAERYDTPCGAWYFWQNNHHY